MVLYYGYVFLRFLLFYGFGVFMFTWNLGLNVFHFCGFEVLRNLGS
jgi:hypothetical protein